MCPFRFVAPAEATAPSPPLPRAAGSLDLVALHDVAFLHPFPLFEGHAAIRAGRDLGDILLHVLERGELALVDDSRSSEDPDIARFEDVAVDHTAASNLADLANVEDHLHFGLAHELAVWSRRQHLLHARLHLLENVVDDRVVANLETLLPRILLGLEVCRNVEGQDPGFGDPGDGHIRLGDLSNARLEDLDFDLGDLILGHKLAQRRGQCLY
mmetsp:Transcript_4727/g.13988  ORF Transcript_4727/g.13988 Transcript_4727/m.13988 type:complete len:213 (-) Transcript_4727:487-1125(-)